MHWTATIGLALLFLSIGALAWVVPQFSSPDIVKAGSPSNDHTPLETKIRERLLRHHFRTRQIGFAAGMALLLGAVFLILLSRDLVLVSQTGPWATPLPPGGPAGPETTIPTITPLPPRAKPEEPVWRPSFVIPALAFAAMVVAGVFLTVSRSILARLSGASLLFAATMTSQFHLIKEFKFAPDVQFGSTSLTPDQVREIVDTRIVAIKNDVIKELQKKIDQMIGQIDIQGVVDARFAVMKVDFFNQLKAELKSLVDKIEINIDKVALEARFETYLRQIGALGPEHLGDFVGFEPGRSESTTNMKTSIADVCGRWLRRTDHQEGFLLVVGATDRMPLGPTARLRYESNFGLARARAEEVKAKIVECGVPATKILAIVSGPQTTPERKNRSVPESGYPKDRMVDVWAVWSWRDRRQDPSMP